MKSCCKDVDIYDIDTIKQATWETLEDKKLRRRDYSSFVSSYSDDLSARKVRQIAENNTSKIDLDTEVNRISEDVLDRFKNEELNLPPITHKEKIDGMNKKVRLLGIEAPIQQVIEHVLTRMLEELWSRKLCRFQFASISGRGQLKGAKQIQEWTEDGELRYFVKLDIRKCFPSIRHDVLLKHLWKDLSRNEKLFNLLLLILKTHCDGKVGLEIGSLLSQNLCNYVISDIYRYIESLHKFRRGKRIPLVKHQLWFMDDGLLGGNNKNDLYKAVNLVIEYAREEWCLEIKPNWNIKNHDIEPINMMGYKIYGDGTLKVKREIYNRAAKSMNRYSASDITQARSVTARYGHLKHAGITKIHKPNGKAIDVLRVKKNASEFVSNFDKKGSTEC